MNRATYPSRPRGKGKPEVDPEARYRKPDLLNSIIRSQLNLLDTDKITWLSPIAEDGYAEYQDQAFPDQLFISSTITLKSSSF